MPLFYHIGIYKVQTCIWKVIGIFFVINQPLIEKFKPYNMPLLPHKNVFFSWNLQTNIWILSFVIFGVYPPLVVNLDDLQLFLHVEVLFMSKLTNMKIIYIYLLFLQSIQFQLTCHDILQWFPHKNGCFAFKLPKTANILFFWNWFTFS